MNFTRTQIRSVWALVIIWAFAIAYHYFQYYWQVSHFPADDEFLQKFHQKREEVLGGEMWPMTRSDTLKTSQLSEAKIVYQTADFPLDLNRASAEELEQLPKIGPKMAERIVEYRTLHGPFRKKEDLMKVKGIGKKTFQKIQHLITIGSD
ncbi:MAG: hypothetical protein Kow0037_22750 [Calditrichia bacterium]